MGVKKLKLPSLNKFEKSWQEYKDTNPPFLTHKGFAHHLGISKNTWINWRYHYSDQISEKLQLFFDKVDLEMEYEALNFFKEDVRGSRGIFWLSSRFGYQTKVEQEKTELANKELDHRIDMDKAKLEQLKDEEGKVVIKVVGSEEKL